MRAHTQPSETKKGANTLKWSRPQLPSQNKQARTKVHVYAHKKPKHDIYGIRCPTCKPTPHDKSLEVIN